MHIQAKAKAALSPADLESFLRALVPTSGTAINIEGVSGGKLEADEPGEFAFVVEHGRAREAHDLLTAVQPDPPGNQGYVVEWTTDLYEEPIPGPLSSGATDPNQPGVLLGIVERAKASAVAASRPIDTVLIASRTNRQGIYGVQVTFVGSVWSTDRPLEDDDQPDIDL